MTKNKRPDSKLGRSKESKLPYGNSFANQRARILKEFEARKQISTFYFRDKLGIVHPAGRIKELRNQHNIYTSRTNEPDQNGVMHRIALYVYIGQKSDMGVN